MRSHLDSDQREREGECDQNVAAQASRLALACQIGVSALPNSSCLVARLIHGLQEVRLRDRARQVTLLHASRG